MKKILILIFLLLFIFYIKIINTNDKKYLNKNILNEIMYDYTYLTHNSEKTTIEYFEDLKNKNNFSNEFLEKMKPYGNITYEIILALQNNYELLIIDLSPIEKETLDKYILENSLKFYFNEKQKG